MKLIGLGSFRMGPAINLIAWNVRGLNCPNKQGHVKWVLRSFASDVAILQESKLEVVSQQVVISLWGRRPSEWLYLPSVGCS